MPVPVSSAVAHALRAYGRTLPARPLASTLSHVILARPSFLLAPSYKARGYATATKKATTTAKAKKPAAKKPVARKTTAAATKAKKTASASATKKTATKTAKKPKKAAPKKVPKRVVDPEKLEKKKERAKLLLKKDLKRELKKQALLNKEPTRAPINSWGIYLINALKTEDFKRDEFGDKIREVSARFKALSPDVLQPLEEQARQNHITNAAEYKKWVESHPPSEIFAANSARRRLIINFGVKVHPTKIIDDRLPKAPSSAFAQYIKAHINNRDGKASDVMKTLGGEWKTLSAAEKKPYEDLWAAEHTRYYRELEKLKA